jgi:hypothetical protein
MALLFTTPRRWKSASWQKLKSSAQPDENHELAGRTAKCLFAACSTRDNRNLCSTEPKSGRSPFSFLRKSGTFVCALTPAECKTPSLSALPPWLCCSSFTSFGSSGGISLDAANTGGETSTRTREHRERNEASRAGAASRPADNQPSPKSLTEPVKTMMIVLKLPPHLEYPTSKDNSRKQNASVTSQTLAELRAGFLPPWVFAPRA